jgi:hypothetical protein
LARPRTERTERAHSKTNTDPATRDALSASFNQD